MATYNVVKAVSLASYIIKVCNKRKPPRLNYLKLIKLMYLIERQMLESFGICITNDTFFSMRRGPVLSHTYNAIKGDLWDEKALEYWKNFFVTEINTGKHIYDLVLSHDINIIPLEKKETIVSDAILDIFKDYSEFDLVEYAHENLKEWDSTVGNSSAEIPIEEIRAHLSQFSYEKIDQLVNA